MDALLARIADTDTRGACNMSFWTAAAKRSDISSRTRGSCRGLWDPRRVVGGEDEIPVTPSPAFRVSSDPRVIWSYAAIGLAVWLAGSAISLIAGKGLGFVVSAAIGLLLSFNSVWLWFEGGRTTYLCDGQRLQVRRGSQLVFDRSVSEIASVGIEPLLGPAEFMVATPTAHLPVLWVRLVGTNAYDEPIRTRACGIWGHERIFAVENALAAACGPRTTVTRDSEG
jgi:hypothetical protein